MERLKDWILVQQREQSLQDLMALLRIPSISTDPQYKEEVRRCAQWLKDYITSLGADEVAVWESGGHPAVYAYFKAQHQAPTVLVYGHYDVQPVDPLALWDHPPFEPVIKETALHPDGAIFARGACDNKGQFMMHLQAIKALKNTTGLPCNVKLIIEGEEEIGSPNLENVIKTHRETLQADAILVSDTAMLGLDTPSLTVGLRGLVYLEIRLQGPNRDLHSGVYGGAVENPIHVLCRIIANLKDENNRITIPGFYDDVRTLSEEERKLIQSIPFDEEAYKRAIGVQVLATEKGFSPIECTGIRPSMDVNGIWGGYTGEGAKTVLPSKAAAKLSFRLVPHQDPDKIQALVIDYLKKQMPKTVRYEIISYHGGKPFLTDMNSNAYKAAVEAMKETLGKPPIPTYEGGSIPILSTLQTYLNAPVVLMGFGLDSDAIHSPNEHFGIKNYLLGTWTIAVFHHYFYKKERISTD